MLCRAIKISEGSRSASMTEHGVNSAVPKAEPLHKGKIADPPSWGTERPGWSIQTAVAQEYRLWHGSASPVPLISQVYLSSCQYLVHFLLTSVSRPRTDQPHIPTLPLRALPLERGHSLVSLCQGSLRHVAPRFDFDERPAALCNSKY